MSREEANLVVELVEAAWARNEFLVSALMIRLMRLPLAAIGAALPSQNQTEGGK